MKKFLVTLVLFGFLSNSFAQELNVKVTVNFEQLNTASKEKLHNFSEVVSDYLNKNKFAGEDWEGEPIDCSFNIFFTSSSETNYSAQVVVTSQRPIYKTKHNSLMLLVQDASWSFNYEPNQTISFDPDRFDPLLSFLDYYAFLIIGLDMDSYVSEGGTEYFSKALDIATLGANSSNPQGWELRTAAYSKKGLVQDLLRSNFAQFRIDFYDYHYNGLDMLEENKKASVDNVKKLIRNLDGIYNEIGRMNVLLKVFFDTKHKEIFSVIKEYPDEETFNLIRKLDPSHLSTYNQSLED